ncbi:MAG: MaoC/PaaZ C-terminal domain-containing protein [Candidatus Limnocylindria bacterium]
MTRRFEDLAVGAELPTLVRVVTREDVRAYADASGDHNRLHQDDEAARAAGFSGIIAHGMFTMAHLTSCLVGWLGDPTALRQLRVQFRAPVYMGETIVAGGAVRALDPGTRRAVLDVWVTLERDGATEYPIRRGVAQVQLA